MFLNALYEIGKYQQKQIEERGGDLSLKGVQYLKATSTYKTVVLLDINSKNKEIDITTEELDENSSLMYLYKYRNGSQAGNEFSLSNKVNVITEEGKKPEIDWKKLYGYYDSEKNSWLSRLEDCKGESFYSKVKAVLDLIIDNRPKIENRLNVMFQNIDTLKKGFIFTVRYDMNYLGDIPEFIDCFDFFIKIFSSRAISDNKKTKESNITCSFCGNNRNVKYGIPDTFKFATVDKVGFATEFNSKSNRDYPVCTSCQSTLAIGKTFIDSHLSYYFNGLKYKVIPHTIFKSKDILDEVLFNLKETKNPNLSQNNSNFMTDSEGIIELASELNNNVLLNLVFLSKKGMGGDQIDLLLQDILPSRLEKIVKAKQELDTQYTYTNKEGKTISVPFSMGTVYKFYKDKKSNNNPFDKSFFQTVEAIFKQRSLSKEKIIARFMNKIREEFFESDKTYNTSDSIKVMQFLSKLDIIYFNNKGKLMSENIFKQYFENLGIVESPYLAGVMLLGVLVNKVRRVQKDALGNDPFKKNLKGYNLDKKDLQLLGTKARAKLEEYDSFFSSDNLILATAFKLMMDSTPVSNSTANWYLAGGMSLEFEISQIAIEHTKAKKSSEEK